MAPPSAVWNTPCFDFGQLNDEVTKAMYSFPLRPTPTPSHSANQSKQKKTRKDDSFGHCHTLDDVESSDSECPLMTKYVARRNGKSAGQKRSRQEMEQDTQLKPTQPSLEHTIQRERFSFAILASEKAREMSAKSGDVFGPLLCEMILELFRQKAWSLDLLQEHTTSVKNEQPTISPTDIPPHTSSSPAEAFEMDPEELIQEAMDETRFRKTKVLGLYGQGKLDIGGKKANFKIANGGKRCDACVQFKRGSSIGLLACPSPKVHY